MSSPVRCTISAGRLARGSGATSASRFLYHKRVVFLALAFRLILQHTSSPLKHIVADEARRAVSGVPPGADSAGELHPNATRSAPRLDAAGDDRVPPGVHAGGHSAAQRSR